MELLAREAREAPDARTLPLIVEVNWPPEGEDTGELMMRSVAYLREQYAEHLRGARQPVLAH